jgi:hypothetical protein
MLLTELGQLCLRKELVVRDLNGFGQRERVAQL